MKNQPLNFWQCHARRLAPGHVHKSFNTYLKGHILSSKPSSKPGSRSKGGLSAATQDIAEPVNEAEAPGQAWQGPRERRNGYQAISTAAYYRTERRGLSGFGKAREWLEAGSAESEMESLPGGDGMSE